MWYVKIAACFITTIILFTSCELFGGGSDHDVKGGEVVWRIENQTDRLVSTQPFIENERVYFLQDGYLKAYRLEDGKPIWITRVAQQSAGDYTRKIISQLK